MRTTQSDNFALGLALISAIFFAELMFPMAIFGYLLAAVYIIKVPGRPKHLIIIGIGASLLIFTGYFISHNEAGPGYLLITIRILLVAIVWLCVHFTIRLKGCSR